MEENFIADNKEGHCESEEVSRFTHGQTVYLVTDPTFELQVISVLIDMTGQLRYQVFPGIKDKHFFYYDQLTTEPNKPKKINGLKFK